MSNPTIGLNRIRLLVDINNPEQNLLNLTENAAPELINGEGTQFELMFYSGAGGAAFSDATTITSWSNITSLVVALQDTPVPHEGTTFWAQSLAVASIVQACTVANWNTGLTAPSGTTQQALVVVPASVSFFNMSAQVQPTWLLIYALTTDSPNQPICLAAFGISVFDAGISPSYPVNTGYTPGGSASPQGVVTGQIGYSYWDNTNGAFYVCSGGTNWQKLIQL